MEYSLYVLFRELRKYPDFRLSVEVNREESWARLLFQKLRIKVKVVRSMYRADRLTMWKDIEKISCVKVG